MADKVRHKTFISYHHADQEEVDEFIETFDNERDVFIARAVGSDATLDELIETKNDEYAMRRIRELYIKDSTVTLVFIGKNSWSRKFVDWEIASSLHQGPKAGKPNGLIAILSPNLTKAILPDRLVDNLETGYAKYYPYPKNRTPLASWIGKAFDGRDTNSDAVKNGRRKLKRNLSPTNDVGQRKPVCPRSDGSYSSIVRNSSGGGKSGSGKGSSSGRGNGTGRRLAPALSIPVAGRPREARRFG